MNTNNWADLPADMLTRILKHLDLNTDLTRLRGVCPSWRSALPLQQHYPSFRSHIQVPSLSDGTCRDRPLFLLETSFYFFSPINPRGEGSSDSSGWVVRMGQIAPNKWHLLNPLSYNDSYNPVENGNKYFITDPPIVGEINLLDCRAFLLAKALTLVDEVNFNAKPISTKVVGEWDLTSSTRSISAILVLLEPDPVSGFASRRLLLLRPNDAQNQQNEWAEISDSGPVLDDTKQNKLLACDIAYSNGMFFVFQLNRDCWRLGTVNPSNNTLVLKPFANSGIDQMSFFGGSLIPSKSNDFLYLLLMSSGGTQIHCFSIEDDGASVDESKMKIINKLGDEVLFCSNYVSFSIQSSTMLNNNVLQDKNSMAFFYMFSNHDRFNRFPPGKFFLYSTFMPKGVKGLNLLEYRKYINYISLSLFTKKDINENSVLGEMDVIPKKELYEGLFFPPPAWVKWRCPTLDNVDINFHDLNDEILEDENLWLVSHDQLDYYDISMDSDSDEY